MNNTIWTRFVLLSPVGHVCTFGSLPFTVLTSLTIMAGLTGNIFIITFSFKEFKSATLSVYTVFLVNLSLNNLFGIAVSLPLFYIEYCTAFLKDIPNETRGIVYHIQLFMQFNCLGVGMHSLAAMCYDRYEAFTKLPAERSLSVSRAKKLSFVIWVYITFTTLLCFTGHFMIFHNNSFISISVRISRDYKSVSHSSQISSILLIVLVTIWMFTCNFTFLICLRRVHLEIIQHASQVESVLGPRRIQTEINLYKIAVVTIVMYSILWIPYGVARGLLSAYGFSNYPIVCAYAFSIQLSHFPFGILPFIYIMSDMKARRQLLSLGRKIICKLKLVHPSAEERPPQQP